MSSAKSATELNAFLHRNMIKWYISLLLLPGKKSLMDGFPAKLSTCMNEDQAIFCPVLSYFILIEGLGMYILNLGKNKRLLLLMLL